MEAQVWNVTRLWVSDVTHIPKRDFRRNSRHTRSATSHIASDRRRTSHVGAHGSGRHPPGSAITTENPNRNLELRVVVTMLQDDIDPHVGAAERGWRYLQSR